MKVVWFPCSGRIGFSDKILWLAVKDKFRSRLRNSCLLLRKPEKTAGIARKQRQTEGTRGKGLRATSTSLRFLRNQRETFLEIPFLRSQVTGVPSFLPHFPPFPQGYWGNPKESFPYVPAVSCNFLFVPRTFLRFPCVSWESGGNVRKRWFLSYLDRHKIQPK
jgi:hypothetical protein